MTKILLTSNGLENENIKNKFLELLNKSAQDTKVLFITTAANDPGAVRILSKCLDDLTRCQIPDENITVYDMHMPLSQEEINKFDAIYVCGGSTKYLADRIKELNMKPVIQNYVVNDGLYLGVSAGSVAVSGEYKDGVCFIENTLDVHCEKGIENGIINTKEKINLTNSQAIYINENEAIVFE